MLALCRVLDQFHLYYNVSCFLAVVDCVAGAVFLPFSQEAAANLISVAGLYSVTRSSPFVLMKGTLTA